MQCLAQQWLNIAPASEALARRWNSVNVCFSPGWTFATFWLLSHMEIPQQPFETNKSWKKGGRYCTQKHGSTCLGPVAVGDACVVPHVWHPVWMVMLFRQSICRAGLLDEFNDRLLLPSLPSLQVVPVWRAMAEEWDRERKSIKEKTTAIAWRHHPDYYQSLQP